MVAKWLRDGCEMAMRRLREGYEKATRRLREGYEQATRRLREGSEKATRRLREGCEMTGCEWISRASARISCVWKRVEGVACDEGEMGVYMPSDGEEGGLRCSERVRVIVENGYYGSVRA